jgi:hypothetical protein
MATEVVPTTAATARAVVFQVFMRRLLVSASGKCSEETSEEM